MSGSNHPLDALVAALSHLQLPFLGSNPKQQHHRSPFILRTQHKPTGAKPQFHLLLCIAFDSLAHNLHQLLNNHLQPLLHIHGPNNAHFDAFLSNLGFAKLGPPSPSISAHHQPTTSRDKEEPPPHTLPLRLLNIPFSNVDRLRSTLSTLSLTDLIELVARSLPSPDTHPDKKKLFSVHDFFRYAEFEGKRFFEELDRDGDGQVTLEDLEVAMRKRRLPRRYARDFLRRTRSNLFSKSIGWKQFLSLMEQKEPTILRAYTTLCLSKSGTLHKNQILTSLKGAGLPANEDNAAAMLRYLNTDSEESISYSHFRNFMLLLPSERLEDDPRNIWFEAATLVAVPPPVEISTGSVLKSALAGGLASALSTSVMHPIDSMKVQSLSSFCSTILGTAVRIPCEVLKQRLQAGIFNNVGEAIVGTMQKDGPKGFFRGTGATLCREVPFYVAGMCLYAEAKKAAQHVLNRDLEPWETIAVGALSGGLAAVVTTPFDVMKTRMMTAPPGTPVSMQLIVFSILRNEGPLGLFKGAIPRFFWIAPLGAMNFAGYELAKKAMIQTESDSTDSVHEKRTTVGSRG
uniref:EF-hand domain-containing protein n=1 Tax=Oryza punctata TaxID=4537 RepID=A0A0E0MIM4_ORYPU